MAARTVEDDVPELTLQASRASPQSPPSLQSDPIALTALTDDDAKVKDLVVASIPGEPEKDEDELDNYPDGGREAWLVVLGGMCAAMGAFGLVASIGAFQTWYENNLLSSWSPSQIAWIGSTQVAVCFTVCLFTGPVVDRIGPRPMLVAGTVLLVFGFCMLSLAKQYWQIFLCHAGPIALGMDLVFLGPLSAVGHWFLRRRGLAL